MISRRPASYNLQLALPFDEPPRPEEIFARVYRRLRRNAPVPPFHVEYRPWAELRSTIQIDRRGARVFISDVVATIPTTALEALAEILICRAVGLCPSREARACYLSGVMSPAVIERINQARRTRGFKLIRPAQGRTFDLQAIFEKLNQTYFQGKLSIGRIGWSTSAARTILGHHDPAHRTITISRALDHPKSPILLVEFIVFHEMLHVRHPVRRNHHRRVIHSPEFHAAEKQFVAYREAQRLLKSGKWGGRWEG
ncbi:MAG: SprT-like domain-containing protein [Terriglobia bacterium]